MPSLFKGIAALHMVNETGMQEGTVPSGSLQVYKWLVNKNTAGITGGKRWFILFHRDKIFFACSTFGAYPVLGQILKTGSRSHIPFRVAFSRVIYVPAYYTFKSFFGNHNV